MKIKIALCDDDVKALPVIAGAAESAFQEKGIYTDIQRFTSGKALLQAMEQTQFQVILLDIEMPGMDGIAVGKKVRAQGNDTQIVYVSEAERRVFESFLVQPLDFVRKSNFLNDIAAVVELYYTPPYTNGGIEKASVNLIEFGKTSLLEPGASEAVSFRVALEDMASYDSSCVKTAAATCWRQGSTRFPSAPTPTP